MKNQETWTRCMMRVRGNQKRRVKAKLMQAADRLKKKIDILQRTCEYVLPELELSEDEKDALNQIRQRCQELRQQIKRLIVQIRREAPGLLSTLTRDIIPESEGLEDVLEELTGDRWNFAVDELIELIDRVTRGSTSNRKAEAMMFYLQSESKKAAARA